MNSKFKTDIFRARTSYFSLSLARVLSKDDRRRQWSTLFARKMLGMMIGCLVIITAQRSRCVRVTRTRYIRSRPSSDRKRARVSVDNLASFPSPDEAVLDTTALFERHPSGSASASSSPTHSSYSYSVVLSEATRAQIRCIHSWQPKRRWGFCTILFA